VGILRKLAGLVVEFPDEAAPESSRQPDAATGKNGGNADDVLASIERARQELEGHVAQRNAPGPGRAPAGRDPLGAAPIANPFSTDPEPAAAGNAAAADSQIPLPVLLTVDKIYERAGLTADPQQMNIYRVQQMLDDPDMADLDLAMRARTVKLTLKNMGHDLHEVIVDAAKRDHALDSYGEWLDAQVKQVAQQVEAGNARLKQEIDEFIAAKNTQIEANRAALAQAKESQQNYAKDRAAEEQKLFDTVAPFVAPGENPVVVGGNAPAVKGDIK
jgi:hypothetical protein